MAQAKAETIRNGKPITFGRTRLANASATRLLRVRDRLNYSMSSPIAAPSGMNHTILRAGTKNQTALKANAMP